ncbi:MAG: VWA domain-containing protein [Deltaproteobacteria bacterium]|nr:MAG: VWA domain-containing protein [Deltaproteobacteria bacterium]
MLSPELELRDHPDLEGLGRTSTEQRQAEVFAEDLARWFLGADRSELGALASVVVRVAALELAPVRAVCQQRPALAIQAAVRAAVSLWLSMIEERESAAPSRDPQLESPSQEPSAPEPSAPEPSAPEPSAPEPSAPEPSAPEPSAPEPSAPEPERSSSTEREGGEPESSEPRPEEHEAPTSSPEATDVLEQAGALHALLEGADGAARIERVVGLAGDVVLQTSTLLQALQSALPGLGWSLSPGALQRRVNRDLPRLAALLERSPQIVELADTLGRAEAEVARRGLEHGGGEEVVGVSASGEVARALPSELGLLASPETEDLFYARWAERRLISLELSGRGLDGSATRTSRGPVIACIDASASMKGEPEWVAKALLLAVARRVLRQGRELHLLLFGGRGQRFERHLRRGRAAVDGLLDALALTFDGGTDFDGPLLRALELVATESFRHADVLVLTDGQAAALPTVVESVRREREARDVRVVTVVVGPRGAAGVEAFSDEVIVIRKATLSGLSRVWQSLSCPPASPAS